MQIETAEKLKSELTDRYVIVEEGVLELRRFVGRTGRVKTVNMNGRAIIEFDGGEDISWYDIDPSYLTVVDKPAPAIKEKVAKETKKAAPAAKKKSSGLSPLEQARQQGASGKTAAAPKKKSAGLSPLEQARQQGAGGKTAAAPKKESSGLSPLEQARQQGAAGAKPKAAPAKKTAAKKPAAGGKKLSPLEQARLQDGGGAKTTEPETEAPELSEEKAVEEVKTKPAAKKKSAESKTPTTAVDDKNLSPLELARLQGPFKG